MRRSRRLRTRRCFHAATALRAGREERLPLRHLVRRIATITPRPGGWRALQAEALQAESPAVASGHPASMSCTRRDVSFSAFAKRRADSREFARGQRRLDTPEQPSLGSHGGRNTPQI